MWSRKLLVPRRRNADRWKVVPRSAVRREFQSPALPNWSAAPAPRFGEAEKEGRLPSVPRTHSGRRIGYTLAEVNAMRGVFGTQAMPRGRPTPLSIIAVQNFKGGVGKSTVSVHLAQYLAIRMVTASV